jgi:hypothetical protein
MIILKPNFDGYDESNPLYMFFLNVKSTGTMSSRSPSPRRRRKESPMVKDNLTKVMNQK